MKSKYFQPDVVLNSLEKIRESLASNPTAVPDLLRKLLIVIETMERERGDCFNRKQLWELLAIKGRTERDILLIESDKKQLGA